MKSLIDCYDRLSRVQRRLEALKDLVSYYQEHDVTPEDGMIYQFGDALKMMDDAMSDLHEARTVSFSTPDEAIHKLYDAANNLVADMSAWDFGHGPEAEATVRDRLFVLSRTVNRIEIDALTQNEEVA